jgi:hypothetical protein
LIDSPKSDKIEGFKHILENKMKELRKLGLISLEDSKNPEIMKQIKSLQIKQSNNKMKIKEFR